MMLIMYSYSVKLSLYSQSCWHSSWSALAAVQSRRIPALPDGRGWIVNEERERARESRDSRMLHLSVSLVSDVSPTIPLERNKNQSAVVMQQE